MKYLETRHERNAAKITTLIMLILTLLLFVVGQDYQDPPLEYGVAINFNSSKPSVSNVQADKLEAIEDIVEEELIQEETNAEAINEEALREEEIAAEKVAKEIEDAKKAALKAEEILREEAENLKKTKAKAKENEAKEAQERAASEAKAKAQAEAAKKKKGGDTPFALIENAPIYPGCEGQDNDARKKCMSDKIKKFISENFDTDLASDLTGTQKINISFKINTSGNVVSINAKASNPKLVAEAKRVTSLLPKMKPGMQQGTPVVVSYGLPIRIKLED